MKLLVDSHTHTVASFHAYSTLKENAVAAYEKGLEAIALTDHGPNLTGGAAPPFIISSVMRFLPDYLEGVRVIKGVEANIVDHDGNVDVEERFLAFTEFGIASMHVGSIQNGGAIRNTDALTRVLHNPHIHVIGHPGDPRFPIDMEAFVMEVARLNKIVEVNSHSFEARKGSGENCAKIVGLCKKHDVRITVSSDAHSCYHIGEFGNAEALLEECGFPEELIVSTSAAKFLAFLEEHRGDS